MRLRCVARRFHTATLAARSNGEAAHEYNVQMHQARIDYIAERRKQGKKQQQPQQEHKAKEVAVKRPSSPEASAALLMSTRHIVEDFKMRPDPDAEARTLARRQARESREAQNLEERLHRIMTLYHGAEKFITDTDALDREIDAVFDSTDRQKRVWRPSDTPESILRALAPNSESPQRQLGARAGVSARTQIQEGIMTEIRDRLAGTSAGGNVGPAEVLAIVEDGEAFIEMQRERIRQLQSQS